MKKTGIIAALLLISTAATAEAYVDWRGPGTLVKLNKVCKDAGWAKDMKAKLRFRPSDISDNGTRSGFSTFFSTYAYGVRMEGRFSDTLSPVVAYGISAGGYGPIPDAEFRFASVDPSNYKKKTKKIKVVSEFTNYGGDIGCTLRFKGKLKRD